MSITRWRARHAAAILLALAIPLAPGARAATSGNELLRIAGGAAGTDLGDYVTDGDGLDTHYRYFVEVPPNTTRLTIDIFDADFGVAGDNDTDNDRDRLRGASFNSTTNYRLFNPAGTQQTTAFGTGTGTLPATGADNAWLQFFTVANPTAGHWRIEVDSADNGGDDVNAYGIRAHDGTAGAGGRELNLYADTFTGIGVNAIEGTGTRGTTFTLHPYVTSGCTANHKDFDYDIDNALTVGGIPQRAVYTNRNGAWTQTLANATLSDNDAWNSDTLTTTGGVQPSGTNVARDGMGIWTAQLRINEFAGDNANYSTIYLGNDALTAATPTANPQTNAERIYFRTDALAAPVKPYIAQYVSYVSGTNPPATNQTTRLRVTVALINDTQFPITLSGANDVSVWLSNVAANGVRYIAGTGLVSQGTITAQPANNTAGMIRWSPGTVQATFHAQLTFEVNVTPTAAGAHDITGAGNDTGNNNAHGTQAQWVDETGAAQAQATFFFGGLCPLIYTNGTNVATPVTLSYVAATRAGDALDIAWTTDTEYRNVGFSVWGRAGSQWRQLDARPVPGRGDKAGAQDYTLRVSGGGDIEEVAIEDIGADGRRTRHASVAVGSELGKREVPAAIAWPAIRAETRAVLDAQRGNGATTTAWISVTRDGIQRVTAAQLSAAGVTLIGVPRDELALTDERGSVALRITGAGETFGADGALEFFGTASRSLYGDEHVYTLTRDAGNARRVGTLANNAASAHAQSAGYITETARQQDNAYSFAAPGNDPWYDTRMLAFAGAPQRYDFTLDVDARADTFTDPGTLALSVWGGSDWPDIEFDHRLAIEVNGTPITRYEFGGLTDQLLRFALPVGALRDGANTVTIVQSADTGAAHDLVHLERVALSYRRTYVARDGVLDTGRGPAGEAAAVAEVLFRDDFGDQPDACARDTCAAAHMAGFAPGALQAWVIATDGSARRIDGATAGADGSATLVLPRDSGERLYVQDTTHATMPTVRAAASGGDPAGNGATLLVLAHPAFTAGLDTFVAARAAQGISVHVADTDATYARYSNGQRDPAAIRALLRDAYARGTRYALLVGADTYDYRDRLGLGALSFVPTLYASTGDIVRYAPADALYGDVDGDAVPDMPVGRWPVRTAAELARVIDKTLAYDTAPHAATALLAAGGAQPDFDFSALSEALRGEMAGAGFATDTAYVDTLGANAARTALIDAVNAGRALVTFVGHSSADRWTFDPLLLGSQVSTELHNAAAPAVVAQWGCWSSYFVTPQSDSIGVRWLLAEGGAAAVIGAGTLVETAQQDEFARRFTEAATAGATLGDALNDARRTYAGGERPDLVLGINLLGDPTLRLHRD